MGANLSPFLSLLPSAGAAEGIRDPPRVYGARASDKRIPSAGERPRRSGGKQHTAPVIIDGGENVQVMPPSTQPGAPAHSHAQKGRRRGSKDTCSVCGGPHKAGSRYCELTKDVLVTAQKARKEQLAAARKEQRAAHVQGQLDKTQSSHQQSQQKRACPNKGSGGSASAPRGSKRQKAQSPSSSPSQAAEVLAPPQQQRVNITTQRQSESDTSRSHTGADTSESALGRPFNVVSHCASQFQQERNCASTACSAITAVTISTFIRQPELLMRGDPSLSQVHAECITLGTDVYEALRRDHRDVMDEDGYFNAGVLTELRREAAIVCRQTVMVPVS